MTALQKKWTSAQSLDQIKKWKEGRLTDAQVAAGMGISQNTLCNWKKLFPELNDALMAGKTKIISEAEDALYKAAFGHTFEEVKEVGVNEDGVFVTKRIERTLKYNKPDITALIFLLTNFDRENWRRNTDNVPPEARSLNKVELFVQSKKSK